MVFTEDLMLYKRVFIEDLVIRGYLQKIYCFKEDIYKTCSALYKGIYRRFNALKEGIYKRFSDQRVFSALKKILTEYLVFYKKKFTEDLVF
jgi:hypothetical protein